MISRTMRRADRQRDEAFGWKLFEETEYAVLATVDAEGAPYCIPVSPLVLDGAIYIHCGPDGEKLRNIAHDSRVCLTCVGRTRLVPSHFTTEFESAVAHGRAEVLEGEAIVEPMMKFCEKFARSNLDNARKAIMGSMQRTRMMKVTVDTMTAKAKQVPAGK